MKEKKRFIKNIIAVMIANAISLLGSIASGFLLPKLFSIEEYGYYKIFTLYLSYTGLLHFGFTDGMLLKISGTMYDDLDKEKFRKITLFYIAFQLAICSLVLLISLKMTEQYRFILIPLGLCIFTTNVITYFQFISQATMRFNEFSIVKVGTAVLTLISICFLYGIHILCGYKIESKYYILIVTEINWIVLMFYVYKYKDIIFGKVSREYYVKDEIISYFKTGFILTISYQILQIILNLDRQFVSVTFSTSEYAVYSFAYSLISMITTVISAISLVLFPTLKKIDRETAIKVLPTSLLSVEILVLVCLGGYFPLAKIINIFLPEYVISLKYLIILFPGLVVSSCITLIIFTYYKLFNYNIPFFIISCITLAISLTLNWFAWNLFESPSAISFASIVSMIIWYIMTIIYLRKKYEFQWIMNFVYMIVEGVLFYLIAYNIKSLLVGFIVYELIFIVISIIFNLNKIRMVIYKSIQQRSTKNV